jgi:hypothetical protein
MITRKLKNFYLILLCFAVPLMAQSVTVTVGDATVDGYTSDIEVPVILTNPNDEVAGIQFDMELSPGGVVSLSSVDAVGGATGFSIDYNTVSDDVYRIVLYNAASNSAISTNADTIMTLHFDGSTVVSSQIDLLVSGLIVSDTSGGTISSASNDGSITIGHVVSMSLTSGQGDINETVSLTVDMDNGGVVGGVQFDLFDTPDNVTISDITTTTRTDGFTVTTSDIGSGTRVLVYDNAGNNISAGTGAILNVDFLIHSDAYAGDVAVFFSDVVVSDDIGGIYWIAELDTGFVTVSPGYMEEPHNLVATSGLDGMVPLAWDAPFGPVGSDIEEDFEDGVIPDDWTTTTNSSIGWFVTQDASSAFWPVPAHTWYACSNDDAANDDGSVDYLITPALNTNGASDFQLSFASYYDGAYSQTAHLEVSTDGVNFTEVYTLPASAEWVTETVDLNDYVNENEFYIAFHSNDNGVWASGWAIDDIMISFTGGRLARNIHFDFNELGQWVITADKAEVIDHYPNGLTYQQKVDWDNPLEPQHINRDIPVTGYNVYRSDDGANFDMITSVGSDELTYTDDDAVNGTTYYYYVTADYSPDGSESEPSNVAEATPVEWIELALSSGMALSGTTDTLDIFVNNESDVSFFYFEIEDTPDLIAAQEIIATDRTSSWSLDVAEVGGKMVVTGLGLGDDMEPGSDAVCRVIVMAASQEPALLDLVITTASVQDANGNEMIWTATGATFEVTVETQHLLMPNAHAEPNEMITIPLVISNSQDVYGIQIFLVDDLNYLNGVTVQSTNYHDFSDWTVEGNTVGNEFRILMFNNSMNNPLSAGTGHIADIFLAMSGSASVGNTTNIAMTEVVVVDQNNIAMHTELHESKVYVGTPVAAYSIGSVDQSAQTFTIELENTEPVYVVEIDLGDVPDGIEIIDVSAAGRFNGSVDGQSGETDAGSGYVLAYDLDNGISIGSGEIIEVSYGEHIDHEGDVIITWLRDVNSADVSLNSIPSSASGYVLIEVELSIDDEIELPTRIALFPAFPNPFNPRTNIRYDLPQTGYVDLRIFDLSGREVRTLARGFDHAGAKTVVWDAKDNQGQNVSAGVYVYRLEAAGFVQSQKLIYLK